MDGRRVLERARRVVAVVVIGIVASSLSSDQIVFGGDPPLGRWRSSDELIQDGRVSAPEPILEVHFKYDADHSPSLTLKHLAIKRGYAPDPEPLDNGYVLSLHAESGDVLSRLTFHIPNVIYSAPPQPGEQPGTEQIILRKTQFALTLPMIPEAAALHVADPQGVLIIQASLRDVPVRSHPPRFRSLRKERDDRQQEDERPSHLSPPARNTPKIRSRYAWLAELFIETAEASTVSSTLDITFVGDNYTAADLTLFHQDVDRVIAHLLTYEPYVSRASQVVFSTVENTAVDLGCVHDATMTRLMICNDATVTSVVNDAGAPYDKIIVLVNDPSYGGSGGSVSVSYNGPYASQVTVHEFGHTLGNLLDEYTLYATNGWLNGGTYVNCFAGTPPNGSWDGLVNSTDYTVGCNYPNWYRPSPCSIMLSLSCQYFNSVSQRQLNTKLDFYAGPIAPALTFSATPTALGIGGASTLSWSSANVTSCDASGGWSGQKPTSGTEMVTPTATTTYTLVCTGSVGSTTQSVTVSVDATPPSVTLTAPVNGATVSDTILISVTATDDQGVARVDFAKDGILIGSDNTVPYGVNWNTLSEPDGPHVVSAKATDGAGNVGSASPVNVSVDNVPDVTAMDTHAPQVRIVRPSDGSDIKKRIAVEVSATDDVGVTRLELFIDGVLYATRQTGYVKVSWTARRRGTHTITARAFDASGNGGSASVTVYR